MKLEVGRISRAHGLRGEVVVDSITDQPDRFVAGSSFDTTRGLLVVATCRPFQHRFLVTFEGCTTREAAEALHGVALLADPVESGEELFVHQVIGCRVIDQHGADHGKVAAVEANPEADLLVLENQSLVPMNFVTDMHDGRIFVDVPAGLFD